MSSPTVVQMSARGRAPRDGPGPSAELLAFRKPAPEADAQALLERAVDLHALISIDPIMGASPVRCYFVFNPAAKARIRAAIEAPDPSAPTAYAVIAYDFSFALHLIEIAGRQVARERAKQIAVASAQLQRGAFEAAADALGVEARCVSAFDADALKTAFFAQTQELVTDLFGLELRR